MDPHQPKLGPFPQLLDSKSLRYLSILASIVFVALMLRQDVALVRDLITSSATSSWTPVTGTVTAKDRTRVSDWFTRPHYAVQVEYTYQFASVGYTSKMLRLTEPANQSPPLRPHAAAYYESKFPFGKPLTVWVNPANPDQAVLEPGITDYDRGRLLLLFGYTIAAASLLVYSFAQPSTILPRRRTLRPGYIVAYTTAIPARIATTLGAAAAAIATCKLFEHSIGGLPPAQFAVSLFLVVVGAVGFGQFIGWRNTQPRHQLQIDLNKGTITIPARWPWQDPQLLIIETIKVLGIEPKARRRSPYPWCLYAFTGSGQRVPVWAIDDREMVVEFGQWFATTIGVEAPL